MHHAVIREQADLADIDTSADEPALRDRCLLIAAVGTGIKCFYIAEAIHQELEFLPRDRFFFNDDFFHIDQLGPSLMAVLLSEAVQIIHDHLCHRIIVVQDIVIQSDLFERFLLFGDQRFNFQTDKL